MCICVRDAQIDRQTGRQTGTKKANGFAVVQNICNFLGAMLSHNATLPTLQTVLHTHTQALSRTQDALKDSLSFSVCICYCLSLPNLSVSLRLSLSSLSLSASHCFFLSTPSDFFQCCVVLPFTSLLLFLLSVLSLSQFDTLGIVSMCVSVCVYVHVCVCDKGP